MPVSVSRWRGSDGTLGLPVIDLRAGALVGWEAMWLLPPSRARLALSDLGTRGRADGPAQRTRHSGPACRGDRDFRIAIDAKRGVDELAVDLAAERGLGEACADGRGDLADRDGLVVLTDRAVGKRDVGHLCHSRAGGNPIPK